MDEVASQAVLGAEAGDSDVTDSSTAAAPTATTTIVASSSADSPTRIPSGDFGVIIEAPCDAGSLPASSRTAPLSWRPPPAAAAAGGSRSSESREVHHVTFAEPCNKYVHSDSGIVLSPDDSDLNDLAVDGQFAELTDDDECDEVTGGQATNSPVHCPPPPVATNAVPGPPIIKLHRCRSNDSQDNPFLSDGELRRKADYIIAHSTILRTYVRIADPDQLPPIDQTITRDTECPPPVADNDASEFQVPELNSGLTVAEAQGDTSKESRTESPQKVVSKEGAAPVRNGEADEPLLVRKKDENGLESSPNKHTRSKKRKCCVVQ